MSFRRFIPFLAAFVLPLVVVYAWWGGFSPVEISPGQVRGPYTYAYVEHQGDYAKLPDQQAQVEKALLAAQIAPGHAITVLYSNPDVVSMGDRIARIGYLVPAGTTVAEPVRLDTIPARPVLLVTVRAAVLLAPSRAYQALDKYMQAKGQGIRMPTVEIYQPSASAFAMGNLAVEMPE
ncbi:MAG: GyrI-like domain-containing protein [Gallionellaceae bacterium]|nr:GyrI-like domain-containing protein [Gallionellaceae bacterium]MDD5366605.1 GyrI-like domain-containing protein [Gallionellaceae bacterium]